MTKAARRVWRYSKSEPSIDLLLAAFAGVAAAGLSLLNVSCIHILASGVLNDDRWPVYMQTLSGVSAALLGFGATAIAVVLMLGPGPRGKLLLSSAGTDLNRVLANCVASLAFASVVLAIAGGLEPSHYPVPVGVGFAAVLVLTLLRLIRLWNLLRKLLEVHIRDAAAQPESRDTR